VIEETGTGYSAYSPDLDGWRRDSKTREQVEQEMREAIAFHLDGMSKTANQFPSRIRIQPTSEVPAQAR